MYIIIIIIIYFCDFLVDCEPLEDRGLYTKHLALCIAHGRLSANACIELNSVFSP